MFDRIVELEKYTEKQAADSFRPIADAVRYCHSLGIVHRDLKPENLLYVSHDSDSLVKVSDFGLAKFMITKDMMFTACGTPNYVAPEIIEARGYDGKVDCWSLGVILYVMLCGFPPFYHDENDQLFEIFKTGTFNFPSPYWDNVSSEAKDLISKLLILDSSKRLNADEILKHPWLSGKNSNAPLNFQQNHYKAFRAHRIVNYLIIFRNML